jgi:hypothetical protein
LTEPPTERSCADMYIGARPRIDQHDGDRFGYETC